MYESYKQPKYFSKKSFMEPKLGLKFETIGIFMVLTLTRAIGFLIKLLLDIKI